jgi:hypothetical protein
LGSVGKIVGKILGIRRPKQADVPTPAQPAAEAGAPMQTPETSADTAATILRKKARGKQSLTIPTSNASGTGGTGLNI